MSFSILILTLNEEANIAACIDSVSFCDDIVVLDSGSSDRTCAIAAERGARVHHRTFDNFAAHRNGALKELPFKYDYVFHLDADERFTPELEAECEGCVKEDALSGYLVSNKLIFMGTWIRHASQYPCYQLRFLKLGEVSFVPNGHGQSDGESLRGLGRLKASYIHLNFSKGLEDWIAKHNRYSTQEARSSLEASAVRGGGDRREAAYARRKRLKALSTRLPFPSTTRFIYGYVLRLGILDGRAGYHYCRLMAMYQYWIHIKRKEARRQAQDAAR